MKLVKGNRGNQGPQAPQSQAEQQMQVIPVQVFACNSCDHVNQQFIPQTGE